MDFKVLLLCCLLASAHSRYLDVKQPSLDSRIIGDEDVFPGELSGQVSLQTVTEPIVDRKSYNEALNKTAADDILSVDQATHLLTGLLSRGISPCGGDSGGPLVAKNDKGETEVVGIVSWGMIPCGRKGAPAVYVRVSSFIDWIEDIIKNN